MAYYFGKRLRAARGVPVGIVMCAWGGSGCSAWISAEALRRPELNALWPEDVLGWRFNIAPSRLYNGMLRPAAPFAIAGFAWYQGETEVAPYHNPFLHRHLLPAMIEDWRKTWQRSDLPFYIVQLPNRDDEPRWVVVRESQAAALKLPQTFLIPTIDIGQAWDLHPRNKHVVAGRLADAVLGQHYGQGSWVGCAMFERATREGTALRVSFRDASGSLKTSDGKAPAEFEIAGADQHFRPAGARIDGETVIVESAAVPVPVAVRYAWQPAPRVNLVNQAGVPVPPFRSDDWPVDGQEMAPQPLPSKDKLSHVASGGALVAGEAAGWRGSDDVAGLGDLRPQVLRGGASASILVRGFPPRGGAHPSPALFWTAEPPVDPAAGVTLEVSAYVTRIGNATRGLDLEMGIPQRDGSFRRYLLIIFPARLHTFQNNLTPRNSQATETRVLRSDLELQPAVYRLAVRPDGIAHVYYDSELVGTTSGEVVTDKPPQRAYVLVGKTVSAGEWMVNIHTVSFDLAGAFAPGTSPATAKAAMPGSREL